MRFGAHFGPSPVEGDNVVEMAERGRGINAGGMPTQSGLTSVRAVMNLDGRKTRIAYLVTHPIQYQAPLLRMIANEPDIDLTVFFATNLSAKKYFDKGFGKHIGWDVDLTGGYRHMFLPTLGSSVPLTAWRPINYGLQARLANGAYDVLWVHSYARPYFFLTIMAARKLGLKVLVRGESNAFSRARGAVSSIGTRLAFGLLRRRVDGFLSIGALNRKYYLRCGVPASKIFMMPYAVDNDHFRRMADSRGLIGRLRSRMKIAPGTPVILFSGKLVEHKRPFDLLAAFKTLLAKRRREPRPHLIFAGDGEQRNRLEREAGELGGKCVHFSGFVNQQELPSYYGLSDLLVLPSALEPWGLVVNESMNAACAVIASDRVGCAPDLVRPEKNGFVYRMGDIRGLSVLIDRTIANPVRMRAMGAASRKIIGKWGFREDLIGLRHAIQSVRGMQWTAR